MKNNYKESFEQIKVAGSLAAATLDEVTSYIKPGIATEQLDKICYEFIRDNGGYSAPLFYRGFPKSCCSSVNHVVCHGIPSQKYLREGDIVNIDVTAIVNGWHGDTSRMYFVGDVSDSKDCVKMVERADYNFGTIDILHNNVGISGPGSILDVDEKEWSHLMQINVTSMMLTAKAAVPKMIKSGGGCIINIASISAIRPKGRTPYAVSKAAVVGLTRAMAVDHGKDHIRVNCILPGPAYTSMVAGGMSDAQRTIRREASPLNLEGNSWDIAWAAVYLASEEARWVTGAELVVDGGISLQSPRG